MKDLTPTRAPDATNATFDKTVYEATCFAGQTRVHVKRGREGFSDIEDIAIGDEVLSRNEVTGEIAYKKVARVFEHRPTEAVDVVYKCDPEFEKEWQRAGWGPTPITATLEHPFWVKGKGWTQVRDLQPGDEFLTAEGTSAHLVRLEQRPFLPPSVYNFEVEDFHTYFVGEPGVWVHNVKHRDAHILNESTTVTTPPKTKASYTAEELTRAETEGTLTPGVISTLRAELASDLVLEKYGIHPAALLEKGNTLGKRETEVGYSGNPDRLLVTDNPLPGFNINGAAAEYYTPGPTRTDPFRIAEVVRQKAYDQAAVVVVDLRNSPVTGTSVLNAINNMLVPPAESLKVLLIIENNGKLVKIDFADTGANIPVHGTLDMQAGRTTRLNGVPSPTTEIFQNPYQRVLAEGDAAPTTPLTLVDVQALLHTARQYWLNAGASAALLNSAVFSIDTLAPRIAAMTQGNQIILSADGAGWGWYVDATPALQEEYGAGDTANEFRATTGSVAEGRMDLLTVMVHELGHVLGLGHVVGNDDLMAQFLVPGERRIPSSADLTMLVQQQEQQNVSIVLTGVTYTTPSSATAAAPRALAQQVGGGWNALGNIAFDSTLDRVTLGESQTAQARASRTLTLTAQDRFLSFTLDGIALDDQTGGPDDAFEVALLDANTGVSLAGAIALSRTDALLNLQANGAELAAQGVTHINNADGSRTYLVDIRGIAAGTAVNLSFDLIGFGKRANQLHSHVTVRDVRLLGAAITLDDSVTTAEDTVTQIIAIANDIDAIQEGFAPVVVAAPSHGVVVVNADGTFSYTPALNYYGSDSFTYKISNGQVDSNVSTVNITVTPVNDIPVVASLSVSTMEDTALTLDLLAQASDVEGSVLAVSIVTGLQ